MQLLLFLKPVLKGKVNKMEIVFQLNNQMIVRTDKNVLAAKSKNYVRARFELLSNDWHSPITVIFGDYSVVLDENNSCIVPWEVLEQPGVFPVSAFCGDLQTTGVEHVRVSATGYVQGQTPQPPTPDVYAQLAQMVQSAVDSANHINSEAKQSQEAAQSAALDAEDSANSAAESAAIAAQKEECASTAATVAMNKANEAQASAASASISESNTHNRADQAEASAQSAAQSAQEAKDAAASMPIIDDTQASPANPWSGAKVNQEVSKLSEQIDGLATLPQVTSEDNGKTLAVMNGKWGLVDPSIGDFSDVQRIVQSGAMSQYFSIGDQLTPAWIDDDGKTYKDPFDIVQLNRTYELESGAAINGMMIQQHYANVKGCPFDAQEALYDADEELPAGTYHFTVNRHALSSENGKIMQFTLTKPIPAGGQLVYADVSGYDKVLSGQEIRTFSSPASFTPIESVVLSEGNEGIDLGVTDGKGSLNVNTRAFRGCGRWKTSMLRQYLNSSKPAGQWWSKQDKWDRASDFINTCPGYLSGFDADFLATIKPIKVQTARDSSANNGGTDITYDRFFPISLEQSNAVPQAANTEGEALDYWKWIASQDTTGNLDNGRFSQYGKYQILTVYALHAKTMRVRCWLRSTRRTSPSDAWCIYADGSISTYSALSSDRCAPACVIG